MAEAVQLPNCLSLIMCDQVFRDERSKKTIIVGTFNALNAASLPFTHPQITAFFTLTDGLGQFDLHVEIEHEESGIQVMRFGGPMKSKDPLAVRDITLELMNVRFQSEGKHWLKLLANGQIISQRPFFVRLHKKEKSE